MSKPVCAVVGVGPQNGAAFARKFDAEGYAVALLARRSEYSTELAAELAEARAYACDVTEVAGVQSTFKAVAEDLGSPDVVIYNAGSGFWGNVEEITPEQFERAWRVNTQGLLVCAQAVIPAMKENGAGNIVVIGATASLRGKPFTTGFAPAKAAQRSLAQAMARHLGPQGIHVSLVIVDGQIKVFEDDAAKAHPDGLDPDDIAHSVYHLATQPRSAWTFELDLRPFGENW